MALLTKYHPEDSQPLNNKESINIKHNQSQMYIRSNEELKSISIYTITGQFILQTTQTQVNISHLPTGIYIVEAYTHDGERLTDKFIKL